MKKTIFTSCLIFLIFVSAKNKNENIFQMKNFEKTLSKIDEKFYMSKYEASNLQYRTFLDDLKKEGDKNKLSIAQIDSNLWLTFSKYNEPYVALYHRHPAYNDYPVVNISYEGAVMFCEWLTKKYNNFEKRKFKKVLFRLPSQAEWENAARGGYKEMEYPWGGYYITDYRGCKQCNYYSVGDENITRDSTGKITINYKELLPFSRGNDITEPVYSFKQNNFEMYNISGNAAEMTAEKGISRGGSFTSPGADVRITSVEKYTHPDVNIGFRICMDLIENY